MRTVESIVSDLTVALNSDFSVVDTGEEVYLAPKKSLVCSLTLKLGVPTHSNKLAEGRKSRGFSHRLTLLDTAIPSHVVRGGHDKVWH
jgi:hypothetical protein